jgi:hypothetical protein
MPPRKVPPTEELHQLYDSGMSGAEIARHLGLNVYTVTSALTRLGISTRSPKATMQLQADRGVHKKAARYWLGKTQPPDMVEKRASKIRGANHYLWKGGKHRRGYRGKIKKESCGSCATRQNLGIHHVDYDHYNNEPSNLTVLCVSCHMSLHKQNYWDAIHAGREPPKSNAPIGWKRGGE